MWQKVTDFDRYVKVSDKISSHDETTRGAQGVVCAIGKTSILITGTDSDMEYQYTKDNWKVWREPKRWRAEKREYYWYLTKDLLVSMAPDFMMTEDDLAFNSGNYFKTREQAQEYADECKKVAERLHEKWGE